MRLQSVAIHAAATAVTERTRVVIVEDDPLQIRAIARVLRKYDKVLEPIFYRDPACALAEIETSRPHLIVMDIFMPGLDGMEACRMIKGNPQTRSTRVILVSGRMTSVLRVAGLVAGAEQVLDKPFDLGMLLELAVGVSALPESLAPPVLAADSVLASGTQLLGIVSEPPRPHDAASHAHQVPPDTAAGLLSSEGPRAVRRTAPAPRRAADVLVDLLCEAEVEVVFGLPGGAISPVHDALLDSDLRVVTTSHESGAMFAAAGYAHFTGKLGVVAVTSGPGVLNALTGLASAYCDGLPMLLLVGEVPRKAQGRGVLQDGSSYGLKIVEVAASLCKLAMEVPEASQLPHLLRRAMTTAMSGRRGPVVLTLPMDVTLASITPPRMEMQSVPPGVLRSHQVEDIARALLHAKRPLILAGAGMRGGSAPALLIRVAERLGCPVATTPKGKGVFPEGNPLALGVLGLGGHSSSRSYLESGIDVVLVLGSSLGDLATDGFNHTLQAPVMIHVDIDGRQIGKSYRPTHSVVADVSEFLCVLDALVATAPRRPAQHLPAGGVGRHMLPPSEPSAHRLGPHEVLREIQELLPADTVYTVDSGEHFTFATHYLKIDHPDAFVVMTGLGSMGQSIGAAIGVKLGQSERSVAVIVGDGCFAMNAFEIATAVAQRLRLRIFVFNDARLGMVENGHEHVYGRRPDYSTGAMDVCAVAAGLGAATVRVCRPGDLAKVSRLLNDCAGPVVVDVQIDPSVRMPKKDRMAAFAPPPQQRPDEPGVN